MLFNLKKRELYIKLFQNNIEILDLETKEKFNHTFKSNFGNQRLLIADFNKAETEILYGFTSNNIKPKNCKIIVHQKEKNEGGLSDIEVRILKELFAIIGVKEVYVYDAETDLNIIEIDSNKNNYR